MEKGEVYRRPLGTNSGTRCSVGVCSHVLILLVLLLVPHRRGLQVVLMSNDILSYTPMFKL